MTVGVLRRNVTLSVTIAAWATWSCAGGEPAASTATDSSSTTSGTNSVTNATLGADSRSSEDSAPSVAITTATLTASSNGAGTQPVATSGDPVGTTEPDSNSAPSTASASAVTVTTGASSASSQGTTQDDETSTASSDQSSAEASHEIGGEDKDPAPPRPLEVTATPGRHEHRFRAKQADPEVSFNDNDQIAIFDNRAATLMGKLVLTFGGAGERKGNLTGGGEFCAKRGFHVLAVAAFQEYNIVDSGPDFYGDARKSVFEGVMYTDKDAFANIQLTPADGVAQRTQKALSYLHATYPDEDWGYFLQADGSVRWSDVIFTGVSHGASNSARFASLVRASRVVSVAGPRDNLCQNMNAANCGGDVATWLSETPKTPLDRFFGITGVKDDQHLQHLFSMEKLGFVGEPTSVDGAQPPYGDSHRLVHSGGHDDVCANQAFQNVCNYAFGVPAENHARTGP